MSANEMAQLKLSAWSSKLIWLVKKKTDFMIINIVEYVVNIQIYGLQKK